MLGCNFQLGAPSGRKHAKSATHKLLDVLNS